jgi:hypothetical protein
VWGCDPENSFADIVKINREDKHWLHHAKYLSLKFDKGNFKFHLNK